MGLPDPDELDRIAKAAEDSDPVTRRSFLARLTGTSLVGVVALGKFVQKVEAATKTDKGPSLDYKYDIAYITSPDIDDVLEYADDVERILGPDVANDFEVMRLKSNAQFILVYAREGDLEGAKRASQIHSKFLQSADLDQSMVVRSDQLEQLFNISYGVGNLAELKRIYATVARVLGDQAADQLVIEERRDGRFALVYKRYGDQDSSFSVAKHHSDLLRSSHISASIIRERNNDIVFGNSSLQGQNEIPKIQPKEPPKPQAVPHREKPRAAEEFHAGNLEREIEHYISALRKSGRLGADEDTSFVVYDLASNKKLVSINEDAPRQAASMIKVFVALAFFHELEAGRQHYDSSAQVHMRRMIQHSNNNSTNWFINKLGGAAHVNHIIHTNYPEIVPGVQIVESIPAGGRAYHNKATAHDYSRFLYALWHRELPHSQEIQRVMALPKRSRIKSRAHAIPHTTYVANKTGSTAHLCGDMGILVAHDSSGKAHPYLVVGIVQSEHHQRHYKSWMFSRGNIIGEVSNKAYREIIK